jgi:hypothetical protein
MTDYTVKIGSVDYTGDVQSVTVDWPATTEVGSCTVVFNNQTGKFTKIPLFTPMTVRLPNSVGTFYFFTDAQDYSYDKSAGRTFTVTGTASPELVYLSEGNYQIVGSSIPGFGFLTKFQYIPYQTTYISALGSELMDIGNICTTLLHTPQTQANYASLALVDNQHSSFRGRLGYDVTGLGVNSTTGVDYTGGALTRYVKGMWQVGYGGTGGQKTGLEILKDIVTKNVIDGNGNLAVLDWYVDNRVQPPLLRIFDRGSLPASNIQTLIVGKDLVENLSLPVDSKDARNMMVYWSNAEKQYPPADLWTNYDTTPNMKLKWTVTNISGDPVDIQLTSGLTTGSKSIQVFATSGTAGIDAELKFDMVHNGYHLLSQSLSHNIASFQFQFYTLDIPSNINLELRLYDDINSASVKKTITLPTTLTSGNWQLMTQPIPASGNSGWTVITGTWDFGVNFITRFGIHVVATALAGVDFPCNFDFIQFNDNWNYSPTYTFGGIGQAAFGGSTSTFLTANLTAGVSSILTLQQVSGFVAGQQVVIGLGSPNQELGQMTTSGSIISPSALQIYLQQPVANNHNASTTTTGSSASGQNVLNVSSSTGFYVGETVYIEQSTSNFEVGVVGSSTPTTLTLIGPLKFTHGAAKAVAGLEVVVGATHDPWSIGTPIPAGMKNPNQAVTQPAYGPRIFNWVDYYAGSTGGGQGADTAESIALNILNSRKGKKSQGRFKVSGYAPQVPLILPGSKFRITSANDVYIGGAIDSTIDSWIASKVTYGIDTTQGFTAEYVVEPWYATISLSPDTNPLNLWAWSNGSIANQIARLNRSTQAFGPQR